MSILKDQLNAKLRKIGRSHQPVLYPNTRYNKHRYNEGTLYLHPLAQRIVENCIFNGKLQI